MPYHENLKQERKKQGIERRQEIKRHVKRKLKYLRRDIVFSTVFILGASSEQRFSLKNSAWYLLVWYTMSVFLYLVDSYYRETGWKKQIKKTARRKGEARRKDPTIAGFQKRVDTFDFLGIKFAMSLPYIIIGFVIYNIQQLADVGNYMRHGSDFFLSIIMGTYVTTVCVSYYSLLMENAKDVKGIRNKVRAILVPNIFGGPIYKKVFIGIVALSLFVFTLIYSFIQFPICIRWLLGTLNVFDLLKALTSGRKDKA